MKIYSDLEKTLSAEIELASKKLLTDCFRKHLGASIINEKCERHLFYTFRWFQKPNIEGRILRLFDRGNLEEVRLKKWMDSAGFDLKTHIDGFQFKISDVCGHFGGSLDGITKLPKKFNCDDNFIVEFKTNGTGAGFNNLVKDGVEFSKPNHFAQMSVYGYKMKINKAVYLNVNKNDDSIHLEVVNLNFNLAETLLKKAEKIIFLKKLPKKISKLATNFECKMCSSYEVCHKNKEIEKNCRSCKFSKPVENKKWFCNNFEVEIPEIEILKGCENWTVFEEE